MTRNGSRRGPVLGINSNNFKKHLSQPKKCGLTSIELERAFWPVCCYTIRGRRTQAQGLCATRAQYFISIYVLRCHL